MDALKIGRRPGAARRRWQDSAQGALTGVLCLNLAVLGSQRDGRPSTPIALASVEEPAQLIAPLPPAESPTAKPEHPERPPDADSLETIPPPRLDTSAAADSPPSLKDIMREVLPAVVTVEAGKRSGSGFFVETDLVITNYHVVKDGFFAKVTAPGGNSIRATVARVARGHDLALPKLQGEHVAHAVLPMGSATNVRVGQGVIAVGSAFAVSKNTVTGGMISAIRKLAGITFLQTDAAINPGNSGGPTR